MNLINDTQSLISAKTRFGYTIKTYDDSYGPLFIARNSIGIYGIVRAQTWEDAYSICEDELFDEATDTAEEMEKEFSTQYLSGRELWFHENPDKTWKDWDKFSDNEKIAIYSAGGKDVPFDSSNGGFTDHPCWQEAYGFRPNGGIYAKDINGDYLDKLTPELLEDLQITLEIEDNE